jgi:hypothetical protein
MVQVVEHLPNKCETLNSNPVPPKNVNEPKGYRQPKHAYNKN